MEVFFNFCLFFYSKKEEDFCSNGRRIVLTKVRGTPYFCLGAVRCESAHWPNVGRRVKDRTEDGTPPTWQWNFTVTSRHRPSWVRPFDPKTKWDPRLSETKQGQDGPSTLLLQQVKTTTKTNSVGVLWKKVSEHPTESIVGLVIFVFLVSTFFSPRIINLGPSLWVSWPNFPLIRAR